MSYRYYIGFVPNEEHKELLSCQDMNTIKNYLPNEEDDFFYLGSIFNKYNQNIILVNNDTFKEEALNRNFLSPITQLEIPQNGNELFLCTKADLYTLIKYYEQEVVKALQSSIKKIELIRDKKDSSFALKHSLDKIRNKIIFLEDGIVDFNNENRVSNSDFLEHDIFNLVYLYKNIDFYKNRMYICGH